MRDPPLVSVVVAFLNEEAFLDEAIRGVLAQDHEPWELILVDDGSSDGSTAIAKEYASRFPDRITYVEHDDHANRGLSPSRNTGIRRARGELIALLDADDVWLPGKLTHQVGIFATHPGIGMTVEAAEYWNDWADPATANRVMPVGVPPDRVYEPPALSLQLYPLGRGTSPCPCTVLVKRSAWEAVGGFEEAFVGNRALYEDQAFFAKIYLRESVFVSGACHSRYRQRAGSIVSTVRAAGKHREVRHGFLEWLERYLEQHAIREPRVQRALQQALFRYRSPVRHGVLQALRRGAARVLTLVRRPASPRAP